MREVSCAPFCAAGGFFWCVCFFGFVVLFRLDSFFLIFPRSSVTAQDAIGLKRKYSLEQKRWFTQKMSNVWVSGMRSILMTKKAILSVVTRIVQILFIEVIRWAVYDRCPVYVLRGRSLRWLQWNSCLNQRWIVNLFIAIMKHFLGPVRKGCSFLLNGK